MASQCAPWLQEPPSPTSWGSSGLSAAKRSICVNSCGQVGPRILSNNQASIITFLTIYMCAQMMQLTKFSHHSELNSPNLFLHTSDEILQSRMCDLFYFVLLFCFSLSNVFQLACKTHLIARVCWFAYFVGTLGLPITIEIPWTATGQTKQ